jgi:hypothetical protein
MRNDLHANIVGIIKKQADQIATEIVAASKKFTESNWLQFDLQVRKSGHTTDTYNVYSKEAGYKVGIIKWNVQLRCYSFFPNPDCSFDTTQLSDITAFLHTCMDEWRKSKAGQ